MKLITPLTNTPEDFVLESLLTKRKAPLSEEGLRNALSDLTYHIAKDSIFYLAAFPKAEAKGKAEIKAGDIDRVDIMFADDDERYLPVFSTFSKLKAFKQELRDNEAYYIADKEDLLNFLYLNAKVAACVLNPSEDDLLLHRMQLQNLIQVGKDLQNSI
ncbi:MAG: SseB family protein [Erysipelotrichaceae bacterium]|nr:SseB family protein [Erysipelotrichaceae bacterium]